MSDAPSTEQHTSAYKLFHYYIPCRIPAAYAYQHHQQAMGTPMYETNEQADKAAQEMVHRRHTVVELVEYYQKGAQIIFERPEDAVKVYQWLKDHLANMRQHTTFNINAKNVPLSDLQAMDEFATMVYRLARQYEKVDHTQNPMSYKLQSMFASRMKSSYKRMEAESNKDKSGSDNKDQSEGDQKQPLREHPSMIDDIKHSALERHLGINDTKED